MKTFLVGLMAATTFMSPASISAGDEVSLSVRPAVAMVNGTALLKVFVQPNDQNRSLVWEIDGADYYRSSSRELDGAAAPRSYQFRVQNLPEGQFEVRVLVRRADNSVARDVSHLEVLGFRESR